MKRNLVPLASVFILGFLLVRPAGVSAETVSADGSTFVELSGFDSLQAAFNQESGNVRLVALLSPSCGYCIKGYRYMRRVLEEVPDPALKMYVIWEPMLSGDTEALARKMSRKATDPRLVYQAWDGEQISGKVYQQLLELPGVAWDVYFLYGPEAKWKKDRPTRPAYWQHQGAGGAENWLNYETLKSEIQKLLARRRAAGEE